MVSFKTSEATFQDGIALGHAWAWQATFQQLDEFRRCRADLFARIDTDFRAGLICGALEAIGEIDGEPAAGLPTLTPLLEFADRCRDASSIC